MSIGTTTITAWAVSTGWAGSPGANVLAENNFGDTRSGGLVGPLGLLIVVLLAIATVLLIRNMNTRLRRLPDRFPGVEDRSRGTGETSVDRAE